MSAREMLLEQANTRLQYQRDLFLRALQLARTRIQILHNRNQGCREEFKTTHAVSEIEVPRWLMEMDDLIGSASDSSSAKLAVERAGALAQKENSHSDLTDLSDASVPK